jgi:hypothetical protein
LLILESRQWRGGGLRDSPEGPHQAGEEQNRNELAHGDVLGEEEARRLFARVLRHPKAAL